MHEHVYQYRATARVFWSLVLKSWQWWCLKHFSFLWSRRIYILLRTFPHIFYYLIKVSCV